MPPVDPFEKGRRCLCCNDYGLVLPDLIKRFVAPTADPILTPPHECHRPGCAGIWVEADSRTSDGEVVTSSHRRYPEHALKQDLTPAQCQQMHDWVAAKLRGGGHAAA